MSQSVSLGFTASVKGSSCILRIYLSVSRGFSETGALSEAAWQVGLKGILESRKAEICFNSVSSAAKILGT